MSTRPPRRLSRYENPYLSVEYARDLPRGASVEPHLVVTEDRAASHGFLYLPAGERPRTVVTFMHPRADFTRHYAVPALLARGFAVWTQNSRSVGNDSMLVHERVLADVAAGMKRLRERGFERIVPCGNSGGGSLYSFYVAQAHVAPEARLQETATGDPFDLSALDLPRIDAIAYLAAHPGEGEFLLHAIDPSVVDEDDPLSCDPALDLYDPANGFRLPPDEPTFEPAFLERYRAAQRARVERIDLRARDCLARRKRARDRAAASPGDLAARREAIAMPIFRVYRTEADPRCIDLRLDPSERDFGSLWSPRPDLFNWGPVGFARVVSPEAWLSTWSALSSRAEIRGNAPAVDVPALVVSYTGDNAIFPSDQEGLFRALGSRDKRRLEFRGDHYGFGLDGGPPAREAAVNAIADWIESLA